MAFVLAFCIYILMYYGVLGFSFSSVHFEKKRERRGTGGGGGKRGKEK